jgi:hypothetical protein
MAFAFDGATAVAPAETIGPRFVFAGGRNDSGVLSQLVGMFSDAATIQGELGTARWAATATNIGGPVLIAGGGDAFGVPYTTTEIVITRLSPDGVHLATIPGPQMSQGRELFTATYMPLVDEVLLAGGCCSLSSADTFDNTSRRMFPTPGMAWPRTEHAAALLPNGQVLITGGYSGDPGGTTLSSVEVYDPFARAFTILDAMGTPRRLHTATLLSTGQVLVVGGLDDTGTATATAEVCTPPVP